MIFLFLSLYPAHCTFSAGSALNPFTQASEQALHFTEMPPGGSRVHRPISLTFFLSFFFFLPSGLPLPVVLSKMC